MKSKAEINRLGDALREGNITTENLIALDEYRRSFQPAIEEIVLCLQGITENAIVQRPSKSTPSIIAKLKRQPTLKLTQIQDIAGLRILTVSRMSQNAAAAQIQRLYPASKLIDRREQPSFGYRAVHLIVAFGGRSIEIQSRTVLQHAWAHFSERLADAQGHEIKYGGGKVEIQHLLLELSNTINTFERSELDFFNADHAADCNTDISWDITREAYLDLVKFYDPNDIASYLQNPL